MDKESIEGEEEAAGCDLEMRVALEVVWIGIPESCGPTAFFECGFAILSAKEKIEDEFE